MKDYFNHSHSWSNDIYTNAVIWRNWSLLIAVISLMITLGAVLVLFFLLPLKENTPFLVFVDNERGEPVTIRPVTSSDLIENSHLKKYMIRKFVIARERYNPSTLTEDAQVVNFMSDIAVASSYRQHLLLHNYQDVIVDVKNINIMFLNDNRAYVSFTLTLSNATKTTEIPVNADIKFHFTDKEMPAHEAQVVNPVNFEVLSYQSHHQVNSSEEVL
jgi:type IV secretion system protein VirB8